MTTCENMQRHGTILAIREWARITVAVEAFERETHGLLQEARERATDGLLFPAVDNIVAATALLAAGATCGSLLDWADRHPELVDGAEVDHDALRLHRQVAVGQVQVRPFVKDDVTRLETRLRVARQLLLAIRSALLSWTADRPDGRTVVCREVGESRCTVMIYDVGEGRVLTDRVVLDEIYLYQLAGIGRVAFDLLSYPVNDRRLVLENHQDLPRIYFHTEL